MIPIRSKAEHIKNDWQAFTSAFRHACRYGSLYALPDEPKWCVRLKDVCYTVETVVFLALVIGITVGVPLGFLWLLIRLGAT